MGKRKTPQGRHWHGAKFYREIERSQFEHKFEQVTKLARVRMNEYLAVK
jgi:hypothetical protein